MFKNHFCSSKLGRLDGFTAAMFTSSQTAREVRIPFFLVGGRKAFWVTDPWRCKTVSVVSTAVLPFKTLLKGSVPCVWMFILLSVPCHEMFLPIHCYCRASHTPRLAQDLSTMTLQQKSCCQLKLRKAEVALKHGCTPGLQPGLQLLSSETHCKERDSWQPLPFQVKMRTNATL